VKKNVLCEKGDEITRFDGIHFSTPFCPGVTVTAYHLFLQTDGKIKKLSETIIIFLHQERFVAQFFSYAN
jgi:hypothetical protein